MDRKKSVTPPRVFVSYSHDSEVHKSWVLELVRRLRGHGIDTILDVHELAPGSDLTHFMESSLAEADKVLMICTPSYVKKANEGKGGVGYEKMIITAQVMQDINANNVIPVVRVKGDPVVPTFLNSKLYVDLTDSDRFGGEFNSLVCALHNVKLVEKPLIGAFDGEAIWDRSSKNETSVRRKDENSNSAEHDEASASAFEWLFHENHPTNGGADVVADENIFSEEGDLGKEDYFSDIFKENDSDKSDDSSINRTKPNPQTRCSNCQTVFEVSRDLLRSGDTVVRCGECLSLFDALGELRTV